LFCRFVATICDSLQSDIRARVVAGGADPGNGTFYVIDELYASKMLATEIAERVKEKDLSITLTDQRGSQYCNN